LAMMFPQCVAGNYGQDGCKGKSPAINRPCADDPAAFTPP